MAVPNIFVNGEVIDADDLNQDFQYVLDLVDDFPTAPFSNNDLQNTQSEFVMTLRLSAADLVAATNSAFYFGNIPYDADDGSQLYKVISFSILSVNAGLRTTSCIVSLQHGGFPGGVATFSNIATGITIPIASGGSAIVSTDDGDFLATDSAADGRGALRLLVTQQGVGYTGADFAIISVKLCRDSGLRNTN